jgi:hypothetical protein
MCCTTRVGMRHDTSRDAGRRPRRSIHAAWLMVLVVGAALAAPIARVVAQQVAQQVAPRFPHARHEKLFPQCAGCHAGIPGGERATSFPDTALCGECHNSRDSRKVSWTPPEPTASNLRFSHVKHLPLTNGAGAQCTACHATPDAKWMHVGRAAPAQCLSCHTHRASAHLAPDNRCASCHVPLTTATALRAAQIGAFRQPASHEASDFAQRHQVQGSDAQAQCAVCHAKESCARCHVNASRIASSYRLLPDARVATLVAGKPASYSVPATHRTAAFPETHGPLARAAGASCANCHARASCQVCHTGNGAADVLATIPVAEVGGAPGVQLKAGIDTWNGLVSSNMAAGRIALGPATASQPPVTGPIRRRTQVHQPFFARTHGPSAASAQMTCEGCHAKSFCADCHAGEGKRRFHIANFAARHAPEAWGRETNCQGCHNTEVFCRGCHLQSGLSSRGRSNVGYHSAVPLWSLQHGQAARQGLQSCTSCHTQRDCMQCHSQGGRGINPHGPGFDAKRLWKANRLTCLRCHFKDPIGTN